MSELAVEKTSLNKAGAPQSFSEYGLSVNPFDDTSHPMDISSLYTASPDDIPFFMGGDRRSVLDEVIHLSQFSHHLVSVLGEAGVGKTALVYQAVLELQETAQCCLLKSSVMTTVEDILEQLIGQLGLFVAEGATADEMISVIEQYQPVGLHQRVVIVVDDAHHLNHSVLALFVRLLQKQSAGYLHVLLVGDSSLLLRLDELDKGEVLVYDIPLCPFTLDELEYYLSFKLSAVGYQGAELFDYDMLNIIWRETRGIPASVNHAANKLLLNRVAMDDEGARLGLPMAYMAVLVLLLAALIMAVFYMDDEPSISLTEQDVLVAEGSGDTLQEEVVTAPERSPVLMNDVAPNTLSSDALVLDGESVSGEGVDQPLLSAASPKEGRPQDESLLVQESIPTEGPDVSTVDNSPVDIIAPEPVVDIVQKPVSVAPKPVAPKSVVKSRIKTVDEEAVMFWPKGSYTLQVMAAGQLAGVKQFVSTQPNSRLLRIVRFERNGAPWYAVLVGVYDDVKSARQAIGDLPASQSAAKPWPRKISDVQQSIESFGRK